jgi:hypothetical protein
MNAKHTPGPWTSREAFASVPTMHVLRPSGSHLCSLTGKDREANARLIAAAPELYEALREIYKRAQQDSYKPSMAFDISAIALAAISKVDA